MVNEVSVDTSGTYMPVFLYKSRLVLCLHGGGNYMAEKVGRDRSEDRKQ